MNIKVFVFDFDGTIVDSNRLKDEAYFELFPKNQKTKKIIAGHKGCRKTRYQIIREILLALKKIGEIDFNDLEAEVEARAKKFGEIVEKEIVESSGVPGAFELLLFLHDNKYPVYILTGTPLQPLRKIIEKLIKNGKTPPFKDIYGRVDDKDEKLFKEEIIDEIINKEAVSAEQIALIGDGKNERDAALAKGCVFVGVANESNNWPAGDFIISDFKNFKSLLGLAV